MQTKLLENKAYNSQFVETIEMIRESISFELYSYFTKITAAYRHVSNIRRTSEGNKIVDHSDVVGASPVGAAPTTSSFST